MIKRALFILLGFAVGIAEAQTNEPKGSKASGRIVEGNIVAAGSKPVESAKVLFGQHGEGATVTTDAQGRYRADLVKLPWSTHAIRALVLAPGFKASDRKIEPGTGTATVNLELLAEPWHETLVRLGHLGPVTNLAFYRTRGPYFLGRSGAVHLGTPGQLMSASTSVSA